MTLCCTLLLLLVAQVVFAEPKLVHAPDAKDPMQVHIYELDNGLKVYLSVSHEEPRFYGEIVVRAGSKHDPVEATGMAHYLEHMLFKGTTSLGTSDYKKEKIHLDRIGTLYEQHFNETDPVKRKAIYTEINAETQKAAQYAIPNELDRLYTILGENYINAHTGHEETVYKAGLPANRLAQWVKLEAERFHQPVFRLFQSELETVYEEMNRSIDNKDRLILYATEGLLYKKHPYGRPIIGTVEHLKNPSLARMYDYFNTYYVPNNMALIISGDIDIAEAIAVIDTEFSTLEPKKLPKAMKWKEKKLKGVQRDTVYYPGEEKVRLAFRTVDSNHKTTETLQVLDYMLDNTVAGLVNINLNQKQRVREAHAYSSSHDNMNDYGSETFEGTPKEGQSLREVEALLLEQTELLKKGEFEDWLIDAVITNFKKIYKQRFEANMHRVALLRSAFLSGQDWSYAIRKLERMEKVSRKDIIKAAKKYFKDDYVVAYRLDGEAEIPSVVKPELAKVDINTTDQSDFFKEIAAMPYEEIEPIYVVPGRDYITRPLRDGVDLYYAKNPLNDLFSLQISIDIGTLADNRLRIAAELMDKSGTTRSTAEDMKKEWYKLGTNFGIGVGDQETTISISGLEENFVASLSLMMEFLTQPVADETTLEELKSIIIAKRTDAIKDHRTVHAALYRYNRLGNNAYYRRIVTNEALQALTQEELYGLIDGLIGYEQTISYVGSQSIEDVLALLAEHYVIANDLQVPPAYRSLDIRAPEKTEIYFFDKEQAQAMVRVEYGGSPFKASLYPVVGLYNQYFDGGMAGIVFQQLREARGLAYYAGARYLIGHTPKDQDLMVGIVECQADKTPEAVEALVDLLDNLPAETERFDAAQFAVLNQYRTERLGFRHVLGAVHNWERKGLTGDPRSWRFEQIKTTDLDKMLQFHREYLQERPKLISITGDKSKIDMEALAQYGEIIELDLEDLFAF